MAQFTKTYAAYRTQRKIKMLIIALSTMSIVLGLSIAAVALARSTEPVASPVQAKEAAQAPVASVSLLIPLKRIEEGTQLEAAMFKSESFPGEVAPAGILTAAELPDIIGNYAKQLIVPFRPFSHHDISPFPPLSKIQIPVGHRAVTITLDARSLIDGFVRPRSRVDVLWHYTSPKKEEKVKTLVPFCKVLAVNGSTDPSTGFSPGAENTATLLVTQEDASRLELAQRLGTLALTLLGDDASATDKRTSEVSVPKLYDDSDLEVTHKGQVFMTDLKSGTLIEMVLIDNKWVRKTADQHP